MLINITVESNFSAPANGYLEISADTSEPVQSIINKFCQVKQIEVESRYQLISQTNEPLSGKKLIRDYQIRDGDKFFLGQDADFKPFRFTNWFAVAMLAIGFGIAGMAICISIYLLMRDIPDSYAIVFDAGSTHTDTLLFSWPGPKLNNTGLVSEVHECHTEGGIAELSHPLGNNISNYLEKCLEETKENIHPDSSDYTEVFFGATAGMRLLEEINPIKARDTMAGVTKFLHSSGLEFDDEQAQIISGVTEGVSGWITVNYLNRNLQSPKREITRGALDLGGASTQISFEVDDSVDINHPGIQEVKLYGKRFRVFCQSALCYGTVQALNRYRALLMEESVLTNSVRNINSPCEPVGMSTEVLESSILESPCTPKTLKRRSISNDQTVVFVGTSEYEKCENTLQYILSQKFCRDKSIEPEKCLNVTNTPSGYQEKNFMGFSGFAYVRQNLNLSKNATLDEFVGKVKLHCNLTLDQIKQAVLANKIKGEKNQKELCFKAVYVASLLIGVHKFDNNSRWSNIEFENSIEDKTLGWALGYMINATESISTAPSIPSFDTIAFALLIVVFIVFVLLGFALFYKALKFRSEDRYKQISGRPPVTSSC